MNNAFLGYPSRRIMEWIRRKRKGSVLRIGSTSGTTCEFKVSEIPQPLAYGNSSEVLSPFSLCSEISAKEHVTVVEDVDSRISSVADECFYNCENLSSVRLDGILSVGNGAFFGNAIESLNLEDVESVGNNINAR